MILGILVMITALSISAVAIYYSVSGLVAIFAAAAIPIIIMGTVLEIGKLVTAVWLHKYWHQAKWWLKYYLSIATLVLMFITSMGIFGFLSKAHIEQTAAAQEGVAQIERIEQELQRQAIVIQRAEQRIVEAEASVGEGNAAIQAQIDTEQERIDNAYNRIQPAIDEQTSIIQAARAADQDRTAPYEAQLESIREEVIRLENSAREYENTISGLGVDNSAILPIREQIAVIQEQISRVQGQIASGEREQIRQAQTTIGANADGSAGPNTRRAANAWIETQQSRINELNQNVSTLQEQAIQTVDNERSRLTNIVNDIRNNQIPALKTRETQMLDKIDEVRSTESPIVVRAREEIQRIRTSADNQIAQSNELIQRLRESLTVGVDATVEAVIQEQRQKIIETNNSIDTLTEQKYALQAEYRKLEAEVGPVKYLAEFIYDDADKDVLEEAVRWVIMVIIFVFDPLAVLLLIASQATFEMRRRERHRLGSEEKINDNTNRPDDGRDDWKDQYARSYIAGTNRDSATSQTRYDIATTERNDIASRTVDDGRMLPERILEPEQEARRLELEERENDLSYTELKRQWKQNNPDQNLKYWKDQYIKGKVNKLPWEIDE